jgi:hypothetical protein
LTANSARRDKRIFKLFFAYFIPNSDEQRPEKNVTRKGRGYIKITADKRASRQSQPRRGEHKRRFRNVFFPKISERSRD